MNSTGSGCYMIDSDFTIIGVNTVGQSIYPSLKIGEKCYKCLMNLNSPCGPCPITNQKIGPNLYLDPIRHIMETVEAMEIDTPEHGHCYAMTFGTVGVQASFAATLPTNSSELHDLALVKALTTDYYDVFSVRLSTGKITLYRHNKKPLDPESVYKKIIDYSSAIENYIVHHVHPDDQDEMREKSSLSYISGELRHRDSFELHYRVILRNEIHYFFRKIARIGDVDSFDDIVFGVGCEDELIHSKELNKLLAQNLSEIEIDSLTGLYTKEAFLIHGEELLKRYPDNAFDFCIMKIDNLGLINHQYGRLAGDKLLKMVGETLLTYMDDYTCLSYFGDGVYASFTQTAPTALRKERVMGFKQRLQEQSAIKNINYKWSVYVAPSRSLSVEEIIAKSQYALSTIRASAYQDYVEFEQSMIDRMDWEDTVEKRLETAIADHEFRLWYQPKYQIKTGKIAGAEALVRWYLPDGRMISPADFIPILERCGKISRLDEYVFREACRFLSMLQKKGLPPISVSVNLSRASMFSPNLAETYASIAAEYNVPSSCLPIEITESAAIRAVSLINLADRLIENGFKLHMDDFGSGYSSLSSLQVIPFECIKLDKTLIDFIGRDSNDALLKHTIAFARESGKTVIAEGVENYDQYSFLKFTGCDMIQGYYFSKPLSEDDFVKLLCSDTSFPK